MDSRFEFGVMVTINEVGVECMVVKSDHKGEALIELCGERFWLPESMLTPVSEAA